MSATTLARPIVPNVVLQHVEDAVCLRAVRSVLVRAPHVNLSALRRADDRLAAHLDGLALAGDEGMRLAMSTLASPGVGQIFVSAVRAIEQGDSALLQRLLALCTEVPDAVRALSSALGWVSASALRGLIVPLLGSPDPRWVGLGLSACVMHRVDPGPALTSAVQHADAQVRAQGWWAAGKLGKRELAELAQQALTSAASASAGPRVDQRAAARALTLWGMGHTEAVRQTMLSVPADALLPCWDAHRLAIMAAPLEWGREQVRALNAQAESSPVHKRRMMRLAGCLGDLQIMPWLIHHMADEAWARLAGESFSVLTGVELDKHHLHRPLVALHESGTGGGAQDDDVALHEDDDLPWPDQAKVQAWWQANAARFVVGQRYFAGEPLSPGHMMRILQTAGQRQRIMAADYLCLLRPGSKLFAAAAPAWRQSRWLAEEAASLS